MSDRTLLLVRHADAAPAGPGTADADRPLTAAGAARARQAGAAVAALGPCDVALVSPARRARDTLAALVAGGAVVGDAVVLDALAGGADDLLDAVHDVPDDARTVLLVGHAPGVPGLVDLLVADGSGSDADRAALARGFAPATLVRLAVDRPWADLDPRQADLVAVRTP